jgi:ABC-type multidrug transport system fused ATPase/permease subunit
MRRAGGRGELRWAAGVGGLVALIVPTMSVLLGTVVAALIAAGYQEKLSERPLRLSAWLPDIDAWLPADMAPLARVSSLLVAALLLLVLAALLLFVFYRLIQRAAVEFEVALISQLRRHAKHLATVRTLSAQQTALTDCLDYHLPRVRSNLTRWWRAFPRHAIQFVACIGVACLIQPVLGLLTFIATLLVVLCYRFLDRLRRTTLPVVRERAAQERQTLVNLSLQGPLLESVHDSEAIEKRFSDQLQHYRRDAVRSLTSSAWKIPTLLLVAGILIALFLFVIAVQILRSETSFSVPAAFSFSLCLAAAALSAQRLHRAWRDLQTIDTAAEELEKFLSLPVQEFRSEQLKAIRRITAQAELEHVTVQDSSGRKLLENVSVVFKPGRLIGVLASQPLQSHALVELLMGLGRPVSGRMLVDGTVVTDLNPQSVAACAHWVASDGTLVAGSVRDNLVRENLTGENSIRENSVRVDPALGQRDLTEAIAGARLTETIQQLPDGLATIISPGDDRLTGDMAFRLAIARAALTDASIFVIEEPRVHYDTQMEQQTLDAMRSLVSPRSITVVLPQRLLTLRQCDIIIALHDHTVADIGTHAELLQRNELYRHLNYLRFNSYRGMKE